MSQHTQSQFIKTSDSTHTRTSTFRSPNKMSSHFCPSDLHEKNHVKRVKSPSFFKQKSRESKLPLLDATNLEGRARMSVSQWNQSQIKQIVEVPKKEESAEEYPYFENEIPE